jgi:dUTP pyrophosphatase
MLNREEIKRLIEKAKLVTGYIDLDRQLTPNGFDLTVAKIYEFVGAGDIDFSNKERRLPETKELPPEKLSPKDKFGWWRLKNGVYKILTNETVNLQNDMIGIAFSRSSLLRMGAFAQNGVWDAGFSGKSEFVLVVSNPQGINLKENARIVQLLFTKITETEEGYNGVYQDKKS